MIEDALQSIAADVKALRDEVRQLRERQSGSDELLTIQEAAVVAKVGMRTISRWLSTGALKRYGKGRASRVKRSELLALSEAEPLATDHEIDAKVRSIRAGVKA